MVEVTLKVGVVAKLPKGVATKTIKVEEISIEIVLSLVEVPINMVIKHKLMLF